MQVVPTLLSLLYKIPDNHNPLWYSFFPGIFLWFFWGALFRKAQQLERPNHYLEHWQRLDMVRGAQSPSSRTLRNNRTKIYGNGKHSCMEELKWCFETDLRHWFIERLRKRKKNIRSDHMILKNWTTLQRT